MKNEPVWIYLEGKYWVYLEGRSRQAGFWALCQGRETWMVVHTDHITEKDPFWGKLAADTQADDLFYLNMNIRTDTEISVVGEVLID